MNNLITFIHQAPSQAKVIQLLKDHDCFDFIRNYLLATYDIDFTGTRFIDEQNVLSLSDVKVLIIQGLKLAIK